MIIFGTMVETTNKSGTTNFAKTLIVFACYLFKIPPAG